MIEKIHFRLCLHQLSLKGGKIKKLNPLTTMVSKILSKDLKVISKWNKLCVLCYS